MARIVERRAMDAPAPVVWDVITDHDLYAAVAPNLSTVEVVDGEGEGMVRRCVDASGNEWTETCTRWEAGEGFAVTVDVEHSDLHRRLFDRFEGEWSLSERDEDVLVTIRFEFEPKYGPLGVLISRFFAYKAPGILEPILDAWAEEARTRTLDADGGSGGGRSAEPRTETAGEPHSGRD